MLVEWLDERIAARPCRSYLPKGQALAYVPNEILKCVLFLGYKDAEGKHVVQGTAFWVSREGPDDIREEYRPVYLVTAGHVIEKIRERSLADDQGVWISVNTSAGRRWERVYNGSWKFHPDYPFGGCSCFENRHK